MSEHVWSKWIVFLAQRLLIGHILLDADADRDFRNKIYPFTCQEWTVFDIILWQFQPLLLNGWTVQHGWFTLVGIAWGVSFCLFSVHENLLKVSFCSNFLSFLLESKVLIVCYCKLEQVLIFQHLNGFTTLIFLLIVHTHSCQHLHSSSSTGSIYPYWMS